ncbi:hypothetical protein [Sphingobium sp.]|uniref:hypothetical protein n=1 Tax=Sphingobium sp. TaxID=1912891 RepID=UPI003BB557D1
MKHRDMLPPRAHLNDKQGGFGQEDMDVLLEETASLRPISADDLRHHMIVQLTVYYKGVMNAMSGVKRRHPGYIPEIVAAITKGWDKYRIHAQPTDMDTSRFTDPGKNQDKSPT